MLRFCGIVLLLLMTVMPCECADATASGDVEPLRLARENLKNAVEELGKAVPDLKPFSDGVIPTLEEREATRRLWSGAYHAERELSGLGRVTSQAFARPLFLARYRWTLELLKALEDYPDADVIFNEPDAVRGIPSGALRELKLWAATATMDSTFLAAEAQGFFPDGNADAEASDWRREDRERLWELYPAGALELAAEGLGEAAGWAARAAYLQLQEHVSYVTSKTRLLRWGENYVTPERARELGGRLQPGDILLSRKEWYVSNVGIPGFWTHATLYAGGPEEWGSAFADPQVRAWVVSMGRADGDFAGLIRDRFPEESRNGYRKADAGEQKVVETNEHGVMVATIAESAAADSLAALRPALSPLSRAVAVYRAYSYLGRPYDYDFDLRTDSVMLCSELIQKSYTPTREIPGLSMPGRLIYGNPMLSPNDIARWYDLHQKEGGREASLVFFVEGSRGTATELGEPEFRESWKNSPLGRLLGAL